MDQSHDYRISDDIYQKLQASREAAAVLEQRTVLCPICRFRLMEVYGRDHHLTKVKCRKCKFEDIIDTALFRTVGYRKTSHFRNNRKKPPLR